MKVNTKNFGEIETDESNIIDFPNGLLAFDEEKKFVIIDNPDENIPFQWLQSTNNPDLAFVIINPFAFKKDYEFELSQSIVEKLKIQNENEVAVYTIVVVPEDINNMTANLLGPIIINTKTKLGKQIVLDNKSYSTKHYILKELQSLGQEE